MSHSRSWLLILMWVAIVFAIPTNSRADQRNPWRNLFVTPAGQPLSTAAGNESFHRLFSPAPATSRPPEFFASAVQGQTAAPPAQPAHTGFKALIRDTASDFASFPRRRSTYVLLGVGAALAGLAHPIDDNVNARLIGRGWSKDVFTLGKYIGRAYYRRVPRSRPIW